MRRLAQFLLDTLLILAAGAALSAWLVSATGSSLGDRELSGQYSASTLDAMRAEREQQRSFAGRSVDWFFAALKGDLGRSELSQAPVSSLLLERAPATITSMAVGAGVGFLWGAAIAAFAVLLAPVAAVEWIAGAAFLALLSLPAGLVVLFAVFGRIPLAFAVGAVVSPKVYFYAARLFRQQKDAQWYLTGIAAGVAPLRLTLVHALPAVRSELAALFGFSLITALAACIPAEVLAGEAGIGQLAWKSAMERDLPVVVGVTLCIALVSRTVTLVSTIPLTTRDAAAATRWAA